MLLISTVSEDFDWMLKEFHEQIEKIKSMFTFNEPESAKSDRNNVAPGCAESDDNLTYYIDEDQYSQTDYYYTYSNILGSWSAEELSRSKTAVCSDEEDTLSEQTIEEFYWH